MCQGTTQIWPIRKWVLYFYIANIMVSLLHDGIAQGRSVGNIQFPLISNMEGEGFSAGIFFPERFLKNAKKMLKSWTLLTLFEMMSWKLKLLRKSSKQGRLMLYSDAIWNDFFNIGTVAFYFSIFWFNFIFIWDPPTCTLLLCVFFRISKWFFLAFNSKVQRVCHGTLLVSLIPQYRLYHSIAYIKEYMSVSLIPRFIYYHVFLFSWYVTVHTINTWILYPVPDCT